MTLAARAVTSRIGRERLKGRARPRARCPLSLFLLRPHAILLIVSGSFVLETSSSSAAWWSRCSRCRDLWAGIASHLTFVAVDFVVDRAFVLHLLADSWLTPCKEGLLCSRRVTAARGTRATLQKAMTQSRKCYRYYALSSSRAPFGSCPPTFAVYTDVMQTALLGSHATIVP